MTAIGCKRSRSPLIPYISSHVLPSNSPSSALSGSQPDSKSFSITPQTGSSFLHRGFSTPPSSFCTENSSPSHLGDTAQYSLESALDTPSEITLLQRKEEALADMLLFLAKTLSELSSATALESLVEHVLNSGGCRRCLCALRQCGVEASFFDHLFRTTMRNTTDASGLLRVVCRLLRESDGAIGGGRKAASFLLAFCAPVRIGTTGCTSSSSCSPRSEMLSELPSAGLRAAAQMTTQNSVKKPLSHWSTPKKKTTGVAATNTPAQHSSSSLQCTVNKLCGEVMPAQGNADGPSIQKPPGEGSSSANNIDNCALALHLLIDLLMLQNQSDTWRLERLENSILQVGGLEVLAKLVTTAVSLGRADLLHQVLSLLEVITIGPAVKNYTTQLSCCVDAVTALLPTPETFQFTVQPDHPSNSQDRAAVSRGLTLPDLEDELRVLRVLTNLTAVDPFPVSPNATMLLGSYVRCVLLHPPPLEKDAERVTFVLCCAINVAKRECRETSDHRSGENNIDAIPFVTALFPDEKETDWLLTSMVKQLFLCYRSPNTEYLVMAGYYAILIGILSLVKRGNTAFRVPVITAIAQTEKKELADSNEQPMALVVAIIQEFLIFQSNASTLCEDAFIEISEIVDRILVANKISLPEA